MNSPTSKRSNDFFHAIKSTLLMSYSDLTYFLFFSCL